MGSANNPKLALNVRHGLKMLGRGLLESVDRCDQGAGAHLGEPLYGDVVPAVVGGGLAFVVLTQRGD